jgi:hypothetical protein
MLVPELHSVTSQCNFDSNVFVYKSTSVPMLGSGGKSVHIVRLGTRLSCQLHAPSTLSEEKSRFSAVSVMYFVITSRSAVVSVGPLI